MKVFGVPLSSDEKQFEPAEHSCECTPKSKSTGKIKHLGKHRRVKRKSKKHRSKHCESPHKKRKRNPSSSSAHTSATENKENHSANTSSEVASSPEKRNSKTTLTPRPPIISTTLADNHINGNCSLNVSCLSSREQEENNHIASTSRTNNISKRAGFVNMTNENFQIEVLTRLL